MASRGLLSMGPPPREEGNTLTCCPPIGLRTPPLSRAAGSWVAAATVSAPQASHMQIFRTQQFGTHLKNPQWILKCPNWLDSLSCYPFEEISAHPRMQNMQKHNGFLVITRILKESPNVEVAKHISFCPWRNQQWVLRCKILKTKR